MYQRTSTSYTGVGQAPGLDPSSSRWVPRIRVGCSPQEGLAPGAGGESGFGRDSAKTLIYTLSPRTGPLCWKCNGTYLLHGFTAALATRTAVIVAKEGRLPQQ